MHTELVVIDIVDDFEFIEPFSELVLVGRGRPKRSLVIDYLCYLRTNEQPIEFYCSFSLDLYYCPA